MALINGIDVEKIAKMQGIELEETSKLQLDDLEGISGGNGDYVNEILHGFGQAFAAIYVAGMIVQEGKCPVCGAEIPTSGDTNDKEAVDTAMEHVKLIHLAG